MDVVLLDINMPGESGTGKELLARAIHQASRRSQQPFLHGNVRELRSIIQSSLNLSQGRPITPAHLPPDLPRPRRAKTTAPAGEDAPVLSMAEVE